MATYDPSSLAPRAPSDIAALAARLRDGPLRNLDELRAQVAELTLSRAGCTTSRVDDLDRLVRLSLAAMEQFQAFTAQLAAALRELTDARRYPH